MRSTRGRVGPSGIRLETPEAGTFFDRFYIVAPLGEGGMSQVLLAFDLHEVRFVALKFLTGLFATNPKAVARLRREGEIYRALDHPNVVRVHEVAERPPAAPFLVLEYIRGREFDEILADRDAALSIPRVVRLLEDSAAGLHAAHRHGVIHRDVKPQNLMVRTDGSTVVLDFGIAHASDGLIRTQRGSVLGTLAYAAPELRDGREADHRVDLFGLGAVVYEALTGRRAVPPGNFEEMTRARTADLESPAQLIPGFPERLDRLVMRLLADAPDDRPADLKAVMIEIGLMRVELDPAERLAVFGDEVARDLDEASKAYHQGEIRRGLELAQALAERSDPEHQGEILHLTGLLQIAAGQPAVGVHYLTRALAERPDDMEIVVDLGVELIRLAKLDRVEDTLRGLPSWIRGQLLVRSLLDLVRVLEEAPVSVLTSVPAGAAGSRLCESLRKK